MAKFTTTFASSHSVPPSRRSWSGLAPTRPDDATGSHADPSRDFETEVPNGNRAAGDLAGDHRVDHGPDASGSFDATIRRCLRTPVRPSPGLSRRRKSSQPRAASG